MHTKCTVSRGVDLYTFGWALAQPQGRRKRRERGGGRRGSHASPATKPEGQTYHFAPPPRNLEKAQGKTVRKMQGTTLQLFGRFEGPIMRSEDPGSLREPYGSSEGPVGSSEDLCAMLVMTISTHTQRTVCV